MRLRRIQFRLEFPIGPNTRLSVIETPLTIVAGVAGLQYGISKAARRMSYTN